MKISKRQLKRLIKEFSEKGAAEYAAAMKDLQKAEELEMDPLEKEWLDDYKAKHGGQGPSKNWGEPEAMGYKNPDWPGGVDPDQKESWAMFREKHGTMHPEERRVMHGEDIDPDEREAIAMGQVSPEDIAAIRKKFGRKNESRIRITRSQLRKIIQEACDVCGGIPEDKPMVAPGWTPDDDEEAGWMPMQSDVPVPQDYDAVMGFLENNDQIVGWGISAIMKMAGASCRKSTVQAIIDYLQILKNGNNPAY